MTQTVKCSVSKTKVDSTRGGAFGLHIHVYTHTWIHTCMHMYMCLYKCIYINNMITLLFINILNVDLEVSRQPKYSLSSAWLQHMWLFWKNIYHKKELWAKLSISFSIIQLGESPWPPHIPAHKIYTRSHIQCSSLLCIGPTCATI